MPLTGARPRQAGCVLRAIWVTVIVACALSACLGQPPTSKESYKDRTLTFVLDSGVPPENRTADLFYVIWVSGAEHAKVVKGHPVEGRECTERGDVSYDGNSGTLHYDPSVHAVERQGLEIVVAVEYHADTFSDQYIGSRCATQTAIAGFSGRAAFQGDLRDDLTVDLVGEPQNGFLSFNKSYFFPVGKKVHVNLTRVERLPEGHMMYVTGDFEVVNLGLFTPDRLVAARA